VRRGLEGYAKYRARNIRKDLRPQPREHHEGWGLGEGRGSCRGVQNLTRRWFDRRGTRYAAALTILSPGNPDPFDVSY
jgi:hypothetical protein